MSWPDKFVSPADIPLLAQKLRQSGRRIVFTNGCFDLLHVGHVRLLYQAKQYGDILLVAINTDASIRRNKGPSRPVISEMERAELLASLEMVDYVTLFGEPTPKDIIDLLIPHVLVKGGDWGENAIVGRDTVEAYGGTVIRIPPWPGHSTSSLIQIIQERFS